jgi:hypothetical protein
MSKTVSIHADQVEQFLSELAQVFESKGNQKLLDRIDVARKYYFSHVATSEFLGEAMQALRAALDQGRDMLSPEQAELAMKYVNSIERQWFGGTGNR